MKTKVIIVTLVLSLLFVAPSLARGASPSTLPSGRGLEDAALRSCQARESAVKGRMKSLTDLAANIERVFDAIATRVENFYANKVVPSGKTVSSYDALVADIAAKKGVVTTDLAIAQSLINSFSCTAGDPRGLLTQFRIDMQKVKSDLKDFRTSIKNLIVAVRTLSPSPSPTATP